LNNLETKKKLPFFGQANQSLTPILLSFEFFSLKFCLFLRGCIEVFCRQKKGFWGKNALSGKE
jgi:hypothetical protein